jgi:hypothetical protein
MGRAIDIELRLRLFQRKTFSAEGFPSFPMFGCTKKCGQRKT